MSSHVVTLRNAILEARAALTSNADLTALVPVAQITYGNSPQKDVMPRIVIEASGTEYDATFMASRKVQTFTLEYAVYSDSVDACTNIMDKMRDALDIYDSSEFSIRVTDESFQAEVDGTLVGVVVATFQDADGAPGFGAGLTALNDLADALEEVSALEDSLDQAQADQAALNAQWVAATGYTLAEYQALPPAQIAYPNILHMDIHDDVGVETWGANSYQAMLVNGEFSPGPAPTSILNVSEIDTVTDPEYLKTLVHNNEFGNKHRFTYDDGTEATEYYSNSIAVADGGSTLRGPGGDGYTGTNPRYIIDHYTGLGYYRSSYNRTNVANGDWYESRGMYDHYTSMQDVVDKPSTFTYAGYSDWRRPTMQEWLFSLGNFDWTNFMTGSDEGSSRDIYFPPLNMYSRGFGANILFQGPVDIFNNSNNASTGFSWYIPATQTNGNYITGITQATIETRVADGNNSNYATLLCRRHYDNS